VFHVTARKVCQPGYAVKVRFVEPSTKDLVYARYGVPPGAHSGYEIDHLIPLELGGSNSMRNLWPEAAAPRPGFHEKDRLEDRLHGLVCSGRMTLRRAQRLIARDWVQAFRRYVAR
jgi:hypothetical protein